MEIPAYYRIANRSASTEQPPAPFFRLGTSAPLTHIRDCFKQCLVTALRTAFDGGDAFSVLEVRPPLILSVSAPDPTINHTSWAVVTVVFEVPIDLLEGLDGLDGSGGDAR